MKASKLELLTALTDIDPKYLKNSHRFLKPEPKWRILMKKSVKWTEKLIGAAVAAVIVLGLIFLPGLWQENTPSPNHTEQPKAVPENSASSEEAKPLRVLMEADVGAFHMYRTRKSALSGYGSKTKSFQKVIEELGGPKEDTIKLEFLPLEGTDREMALTALQTEIMAGGGPDLYVSFAGTAIEEPTAKSGIQAAGYWSEETPVFPYPQQAMERGMFLNLDEYLPKAQFMKLENLPEPLAKAGQYEGSQYILPMTYTVPLICFDRASVDQPEFSDTMTWEEMVDGGPVLKAAAGADMTSLWVGAPIGPLIDGERLSFTEDELLGFVKDKWELFQYSENTKNDMPRRQQVLCSNMESQLRGYSAFDDCEIFTFVPWYSKRGGYGALIKTYVAINANTEKAEDAFFIMDYLLSEECQNSNYYKEFTYGQSVPSMAGEGPLTGFAKEENHEAYCDLRKHITFAEFETPLNCELSNILYYVQQDNGKNIESTVHDGYIKMQALLDES